MTVQPIANDARLYPLRSPHELLPVEHNLALIPTML